MIPRDFEFCFHSSHHVLLRDLCFQVCCQIEQEFFIPQKRVQGRYCYYDNLMNLLSEYYFVLPPKFHQRESRPLRTYGRNAKEKKNQGQVYGQNKDLRFCLKWREVEGVAPKQQVAVNN